MPATLKFESDNIVRDALSQYRRNPGTLLLRTHFPPKGRSAVGLARSIGHAVTRALEEGTMPCVEVDGELAAAIFPKAGFDRRGRAVVTIYRRDGDWGIPNPDAYARALVKEHQHELLRRIASPPAYLSFVGLTSFRENVLAQLAGTDDFVVRRAMLDELQALGWIEVYDADHPPGRGSPVKALRLTPEGWRQLAPPGRAA